MNSVAVDVFLQITLFAFHSFGYVMFEQFYLENERVQNVQIFVNTCIFFFNCSHSNGYEVILLWFWFVFLMIRHVEKLGHLYIIFGESLSFLSWKPVISPSVSLLICDVLSTGKQRWVSHMALPQMLLSLKGQTGK